MNINSPTQLAKPKLAINENRFINFIRNRLGIIIHPHQLKDLQKTILAACHKFNYQPEEYFQLLTSCSTNSPLLEHLVLGITIGETYFFRDKTQMDLLEKQILPQIILEKRKQNNLNLRIWSAGCASGEELFTIAIFLHELLPDLSAWTIQLLGTDINTQVLHRAVVGRYKEWSMRSISPYYKNKYFTKVNNEYLISSSLSSLVNFFYLNLNDDNFPSISNGTNAQDLILCRNVLIYFDSERINLLMKKFSACLIKEGYLLLGASDPINIKDSHLSAIPHSTALFSRQEAPVRMTPEPPQEIISATSLRLPAEAFLHKPRPQKPKHPLFIDERTVHQLLAESKWQDILNYAGRNEKKPVFLLNAEATAWANLGKLDQAAHTCEKSLSVDKANKNTYLIQAMILLELNRIEAAEAALKKAIFLDHTFVFAHFQLGLLLLRNKKLQAGSKCLKNALHIAQTQTPSHPVSGVESLNYGRLVEILEHEIELNSDEKRKSS